MGAIGNGNGNVGWGYGVFLSSVVGYAVRCAFDVYAVMYWYGAYVVLRCCLFACLLWRFSVSF